MLQGQYYENCIRTAKGYCRIMWQQNSGTTPDSFQLDTQTAAAGANANVANAWGGTTTTGCPALGYIGRAQFIVCVLTRSSVSLLLSVTV